MKDCFNRTKERQTLWVTLGTRGGGRGSGYVAKEGWLGVSIPEECALAFVPAGRAELCNVAVSSHMWLFAFKFVSSVQPLSCVRLFAIPWTAARQASLFITSSHHKLMSMESVMPSNHLILCCPLLLLSIFPSIRVFSNESALRIGWSKYWSFSFNISPSNEHWLD